MVKSMAPPTRSPSRGFSTGQGFTSASGLLLGPRGQTKADGEATGAGVAAGEGGGAGGGFRGGGPPQPAKKEPMPTPISPKSKRESGGNTHHLPPLFSRKFSRSPGTRT